MGPRRYINLRIFQKYYSMRNSMETLDTEFIGGRIDVIKFDDHALASMISPHFEDIVNWEYAVLESEETILKYGYIDHEYFDFRIEGTNFVRTVKIVFNGV
jgi:hypothetical protein